MTKSDSIQILLSKNEKKNQKLIDINIIKSQTKYEILELLKNNEMSFEEIVENTSKSKATISMHLKNLREEGIVKHKPNPLDNRKKIFYLSAEVLGAVDTSKVKTVKENQTKLLIDEFIENGDIEYTLLLVHTFKSILVEFGIDIDFVVQSIGNHIGEYLFKELYDEDFDVFTQNITQYWKNNNLGNLSFEFGNNIQVSCTDCFECSNLPKLGKPVCFLEKGMFEMLFSKFFKFDVNIIEIQCYAMGDDKCVFEIEP